LYRESLTEARSRFEIGKRIERQAVNRTRISTDEH
jgi:hypothetical protein